MTTSALGGRNADLKRRVMQLGVAAGAGWGLLLALAVLLAFAWVDLVVELPPGLRLAATLLSVAGLLALLAAAAIHAARAATPAALARRLDEVARTGGQILAGVDLSLHPQPAGAPLSAGLSQIAVRRASELADGVSPTDAVRSDRVRRAFRYVVVLCIVIVLVALFAPRLVGTQIARFTDPWGDHPPYSRLSFAVEPGAANVVYGKSLDVHVRTAGPQQPEQLELVRRARGGDEEVLPMFPQSDGNWQATLASVTESGDYFVRAGRARSHRYDLSVTTVPKIEQVRFRITPPAYTRGGAYEGPLPQQGIAGLPGTKVEVWAKSNRPLSGGGVQIARAGAPADQPAGTSVGLAPTAANSDEVHGEFTIASAGRMTLNVKDVAGQPSTDSFAASITLLADSKPFVRVLEPRQESFATPDVTLPVAVQAEDDYGVARLELYRGLNDSRTTAAELPVPAPPPAVLPAQTQLNLAQYGLKPGDVVKLYARAEDNDPAGAKGSESSVATVRIISTEDMQKLMLAQDVMETLQSKYEQAARRLEGLDAEMQKLLEDLAKQDPKSELAEKDRQRIDDLATQAMKESRAIERSSHQALPLDIDQAMRQDLEKVAQKTEDLARAMRELAKQKNNSAGNAKEQLDWMRKKLGASREEFQKETTEPLDHLARVFPLVEDQAEFVELYQRQRELADRMQSLEEAAKDDPKAKARMRDLQDEQRQAREDLRKLTDRIDEHVAKLPKDAKYDDLRKTASQFADNVRASDAANEMSKAEMALNDFSGKEAHGASKTAADILEKFIEKGDQVGKQGEQACMKFSPQMAGKMGNSIQQMLDAMKMGEGFGQGIGAGGGATARRSSLDNVGLYGALPRRSEWASKSQGGQAKRGTSSDGRGDADKRDPTALSAADKTKTTGDSAAAVPAAYRRRVGEYFQRVADELGEK